MTISLTIILLSGIVEGKNRRKGHHNRKTVPVEITRELGNGRFDIDKQASDLLMFLSKLNLKAHVGQGSIHNIFGLEHLNAMDVSISPKSIKGKRLIAFLKLNWIPFLSISGRKKGVSTGPHIHIGFPSPRTYVKHPVGSTNGKFNGVWCPIYKKNGICF